MSDQREDQRVHLRVSQSDDVLEVVEADQLISVVMER